MSVYIVALPRTGSTVLAKAFMAEHGWKIYSEPWNRSSEYFGKLDIEKIEKDSPIVVKTMIDHVPYYHKGPKYEFHAKISKQFDKVILLDRFNTFLQSESLGTAEKTKVWHEKYIPVDLTEKEFIETRKWLETQKAELDALSNRINTIIIHYEDLYSGNKETRDKLLSSWNINSSKAKELLNPKYKYRQKTLIRTML